ncbi:protein transport protein Sec16B isoform X3 [Girardinichthys multiradiatus]|uniref:protein transport protein Sec16B isoform X3 n=1 Tax=Girardinichthys multiradiatus TaxID=208333 RepID=UPI001FAC55BD|nr:protein transport protein Sec16B isoform X3 [Girardinichthys multiradiatus]
MDQRSHQLSESSRRPHRIKDKEHYSRFAQQEWDLNYPPTGHRERDQHWGRPDARYMTHFTSPPARPQLFPYNSQEYDHGYGWQEHHRSQSSIACSVRPAQSFQLNQHDYPPHYHWDYRDGYGYHGYYRGQRAQQGIVTQDGVRWDPQESWKTNQYPERTHVKGHGASLNPEDHRYDQKRDSSQCYLSNYEVNASRENEEMSSYYLHTLESSKTSGLSSSSYELSQYMNESDLSDRDMPPVFTSNGEHAPVLQNTVPLKYSIPHVVVSFGPAGQLIRVTPALSPQEKLSQLEVHSLEVILSETQEQQEMRNFPGPLTRNDLHKVDAIDFAHQKAGACMRESKQSDRSSAALLWNLLILICRQNGQIVGSDIAELLMQDSHSDGSWKPDVPTLIDFDEHPAVETPPSKGDDLLTGDPSSFRESPEKALQNYTQLLLAGRKKEALESAMTSGLWGHALFLASKMGSRSYTTVLNRFTNQLVANDPLQTLFQLLSGRVPSASMCCGNGKWGNWRPHLAVMLSNETGNPAVQQKAILTMGDSLASRGLIHAAHVCYLTAGTSFGIFPQKAERLVLLGSSHRQSFGNFASNSAIQCTELYEYCQTLGGKSFAIPSFQAYKYLYASRLLDCGLSSQAFHYCEVVGQAILRQRKPDYVLTEEVIKLSDRLRFSEGQYSEAGLSGAAQEPEWLKHLRTRHQHLQMGNYDCTDMKQLATPSHVLAQKDSQLYPDSNLDDLSSHNQGPEPEVLYFRSSEHQGSHIHETREETGEMTVMSNSDTKTQHRPHANTPSMPTMVVHTPSVPMSQNVSHHYTDGVEVRSSMPNCPADEADTSSEAGMQMLEVTFSHNQNQQVITGTVEESEGPQEVPKQSTKTGWFGGWFKSKPKDAQRENIETDVPAQTNQLPPIGSHPPPPPAVLSPGTFPPSPSPAGINPFSRRAGQQPR